MLPEAHQPQSSAPQYPTGAIHSEQLKARIVELDAAHDAELAELESVASDAQATTVAPSLTPGQKRFYNSEQCVEARQALQALVDNPQYDTDSEYYSNNERAFVDRHLHFLSMHPGTHLAGYISNLKLMTNTKSRG
jgi:hypothetical protein